MRRLFSGGIVVVWLVLVGMLVAEQNAPLDEHQRLAPMAGEGGARDEWFGVYREERKVGWVHRTLSRRPEGWIVRDDSELHLAMLGTAQRLRTSLIAETGETFGLRRFRFGLVSPAATFRAEGEVVGNRLRVRHGSGSASNLLELDLLSFGQGLVAFTRDRGMVDEDVPPVLRLDESVTLGVIEPLHGTSSHLTLLPARG